MVGLVGHAGLTWLVWLAALDRHVWFGLLRWLGEAAVRGIP
jgi:hypothetical protein